MLLSTITCTKCEVSVQNICTLYISIENTRTGLMMAASGKDLDQQVEKVSNARICHLHPYTSEP